MSCKVKIIVDGLNNPIELSVPNANSVGDITMDTIAEALQQNPEINILIWEHLRDTADIKSVDLSNIDEKNSLSNYQTLVPNVSNKSLDAEYPFMGWKHVNFGDTKVVGIKSLMYGTLNLTNSIVQLGDGEEILVINPNDYTAVNELKTYLELNDLVQNTEIEMTEDLMKEFDTIIIESNKEKKKQNADLENKILLSKHKEISTSSDNRVVELLQDFIKNPQIYNKVSYSINGNERQKKAFSFLNEFIHKLQGDEGLNRVLNGALGLRLAAPGALRWDNKSKTYQIQREVLTSILQEYATPAKNEDGYVNPEIEQAFDLLVKGNLKDYVASVNTILKNLAYPIELICESCNRKIVSFKNAFRTNEELYMNSWITSNGMIVPEYLESYVGYNIFRVNSIQQVKIGQEIKKLEYFSSRGILTPQETAIIGSTIEEIRQQIDVKNKNASIAEYNYADLFLRINSDIVSLPNSMNNGETFTALDLEGKFPVQSYSYFQIPQKYRFFLLQKHTESKNSEVSNIANFREKLLNDKSFSGLTSEEINSIDTAQKAAFIIHYLGVRNVNTMMLKEAILVLKDAPLATYIIENNIAKSTNRPESDKYYYSISSEGVQSPVQVYTYSFRKLESIPIGTPTSELFTNKSIITKYNRPAPYINIMEGYINKIKEKGVAIEMLSQSEIEELLTKNNISIAKNTNTRGFVLNGTIYINGTYATPSTAIHEYTHIILGLMRALNMDKYVQLINKVFTSHRYDNRLLTKAQNYKNSTLMDIMEEVFADLVGEYFSRNNIFESQHTELAQTLDEMLGEDSNIENLDDLLRAFTILYMLQNDIASTFQELNWTEAFNHERKVVSWIENQIQMNKDSKTGNEGIKEKC